MRKGRPTKFTEKIANEICNRLSEGEPLRQICRDDHMPAWRTVYGWINADKSFSARFARAREIGFDFIAEEALEIADTPMEGVREETSTDGHKVIREDMLGHRRLRIDTRLKLLAKWSPKKYGEKTSVNLGVDESLADRLSRARARSSTSISLNLTSGQPDDGYDE